jgi:hypothetical protein
VLVNLAMVVEQANEQVRARHVHSSTNETSSTITNLRLLNALHAANTSTCRKPPTNSRGASGCALHP